MTLVELLELLPAAVTDVLDEFDDELTQIKARITALEEAPTPSLDSKLVQAFGYRWRTSGTILNGRVTAIPSWLGATALRISEKPNDGPDLTFAVLDVLNIRVVLLGANGVLRANVSGDSVDHGSYREVPIMITSTTGSGPLDGEHLVVLFLADLP